MAELVDRRDERRVERRERPGEAVAALGEHAWVVAAQGCDEDAVVVAGRLPQPREHAFELFAHAFAQFLAGGAGERHDEQFLER